MTSEPFEILVVCLGNVCRSPLAERVLRLRLDEMLDGDFGAVRVSSAGVRAVVGHAMDEQSAQQLLRLGGDPGRFTSRQVDATMIEDADLVLTATRQLRSRVLEDAPRALRRAFTIRELALLTASDDVVGPGAAGPGELVSRAASWRGSGDVDEYDVPDPIGGSAEVHRLVADLLDDACTAIAVALADAIRADVSAD